VQFAVIEFIEVEEFLDSLTLKTKTPCEPVAERHSPQDVNPQLCRCGNRKSRMQQIVFFLSLWL
jgi:hypothetical protein